MRRHFCLAVCLLSLTASAAWAQKERGQEKASPKKAKAAASDPAPEEPLPELETVKQKASYAIGVNIAHNMHRDGIDPDLAALMRGIEDVYADRSPLLKDAEMKAALLEYQKTVAKLEEERLTELGIKNAKEGKAFLAANKKKEGVTTLPSGLQYKILQAGKGPSPKPTDRVKTHYRGTLIDGTEFDSSHKRGEPAVFPVNRVIKGWIEALQKMKVGGKWQLCVPAELAYGEEGSGPIIGPNAVLLFEVELLGIEPAETAQK